MLAVASFLVVLQNETSELREKPTTTSTATSAKFPTKRTTTTTEKTRNYRAGTQQNVGSGSPANVANSRSEPNV